MNRLEAEYGAYLEHMKHAKAVLWYEFDALKLRLAPATFYTPDFLVMLADETLEIHEVKGFWEDDARVKIKVASDKFPFKFIAITKQKGQWVREEFK
jgi:hypothetical protein